MTVSKDTRDPRQASRDDLIAAGYRLEAAVATVAQTFSERRDINSSQEYQSYLFGEFLEGMCEGVLARCVLTPEEFEDKQREEERQVSARAP